MQAFLRKCGAKLRSWWTDITGAVLDLNEKGELEPNRAVVEAPALAPDLSNVVNLDAYRPRLRAWVRAFSVGLLFSRRHCSPLAQVAVTADTRLSGAEHALSPPERMMSLKSELLA